MTTDLLLAALHHLLVFGLAAMLVSETVLLSMPLDAHTVGRLARIDAGYGASAGLLLLVGMARVFHGIKGHDFYLDNPWFHAKIGAFLLVALLSILPTLRFLRWRKAARTNPTFQPDAAELARTRGILRIELALLATIFVLAAAMARYGGF